MAKKLSVVTTSIFEEIEINGTDKWLTLIQNAGKKQVHD